MVHEFTVVGSHDYFVGNIIAVRQDEVTMPSGVVHFRDVVEHYGAVAILVVDDNDRIALIHQYRHPLKVIDTEIPAGLLDGPDVETPLQAAQRELCEEIGYAARSWNMLLDVAPSPGIIDDVVRIFVARDLHPVPQPELQDEELTMTVEWVTVTEAVGRIRTGHIINATAVAAILAYVALCIPGLPLRSAEEPFECRPQAFRARKLL